MIVTEKLQVTPCRWRIPSDLSCEIVDNGCNFNLLWLQNVPGTVEIFEGHKRIRYITDAKEPELAQPQSLSGEVTSEIEPDGATIF